MAHTHTYIHTYIYTHTHTYLHTQTYAEFTKEEILVVIEKFDPGKAPGEDGLNSEILLKIFKHFPHLPHRDI